METTTEDIFKKLMTTTSPKKEAREGGWARRVAKFHLLTKAGYTRRQIAEEYNLSYQTVQNDVVAAQKALVFIDELRKLERELAEGRGTTLA